MAPSHDQVHLAKAVMFYMGYIAEQTFSNQDKKIARSTELKSFLTYLSTKAPSIMDKVLKSVSRKCEEALRVEKASRIEKQSQPRKKRTQPRNCNQSNAKRLKSAAAAEENAAGQTAADDEDDVPMKEETSSAQCDSRSSRIVLPHASTSAAGVDGESRDEIAENAAATWAAAEHRTPSVEVACVNDQQVEETVALPTSYEIESGLSTGSPTMANYVKASLLALEPSTTRPNFNAHTEIAKIWDIILVLDFFKTRRELHQYLENREKMPGEKLQARTSWETCDPSEILDTLDTVKRNTLDNKIHRAYGQTMLVSSVSDEVARGYKSTLTGNRSDHTALLEELARKKAGPVSETEVNQIIARYSYEYYAGQRWLAVIDYFGGSGIVLVFITAGNAYTPFPPNQPSGSSNRFVGIGTWYMKQWTEFQKRCVQHIAGLLLSIRGLVEALGSDALERYCHHGCLGNDCVDRVKLASFTRPDKDEGSEDTDDGSEDEDEEVGGADGESGYEDDGAENNDGEPEDADGESEDDSA